MFRLKCPERSRRIFLLSEVESFFLFDDAGKIFCVYLQCNDGFYYIGLTDDLLKDFIAHSEGGMNLHLAR